LLAIGCAQCETKDAPSDAAAWPDNATLIDGSMPDDAGFETAPDSSLPHDLGSEGACGPATATSA
jgi:hypothetical protein